MKNNKIFYFIVILIVAIFIVLLLGLKEEKNYCNVLLSPASASYDQYKNFTQRGEHFKKIIKGITGQL